VSDDENWIAGRYRLVRQLATGGMGTVWEGWDERLHRPVAVKKLALLPGLTGPVAEVAAQRVMREARLTARLHHPNAVQVFDVVDDGGRPCLIMQYVPSRSLQDIVRDHGPLPPADVARIGTQVAAALAAAHRAGIVHRDVKPGNVLIAEDGTAKITDFGISHAFDDVTLTSTGMVTGTPAYLAPEVARGAESDFASDVYSLGATLYMAVEGKTPFGNEQNPMAILHRVASGDSEPPTRSGPLTPMLQTMMSADAARRPSMVDVASTLPDIHAVSPRPAATATTQFIAREQPAPEHTRVIAAPPAPQRADPPPVAPRPPNSSGDVPPDDRHPRRSWIPIAAALLVVALGVVLAVVLLGSNGSSNNTAATGSTTPAPSTGASRTSAGTKSTSSAPRTSPSSRTSSAPKKNASPTDQQLANAVVQYFSLIPGNLDAGWNMLTPHFQSTRANNRQTYDSYWGGVQRVDVSNASGQSPNRASATLTYHFKDGRVVTEQTGFRFVRRDGALKIDEES